MNRSVDARDIGLPQDWPTAAIGWAEANPCVDELWLFGSRARGTARADSDVDLGLVLAPPDSSGTDWSLGLYLSSDRLWRQQLEAAVGAQHVSVEIFGRLGEEEPDEIIAIRTYAQKLWTRPRRPI